MRYLISGLILVSILLLSMSLPAQAGPASPDEPTQISAFEFSSDTPGLHVCGLELPWRFMAWHELPDNLYAQNEEALLNNDYFKFQIAIAYSVLLEQGFDETTAERLLTFKADLPIKLMREDDDTRTVSVAGSLQVVRKDHDIFQHNFNFVYEMNHELAHRNLIPVCRLIALKHELMLTQREYIHDHRAPVKDPNDLLADYLNGDLNAYYTDHIEYDSREVFIGQPSLFAYGENIFALITLDPAGME